MFSAALLILLHSNCTVLKGLIIVVPIEQILARVVDQTAAFLCFSVGTSKMGCETVELPNSYAFWSRITWHTAINLRCATFCSTVARQGDSRNGHSCLNIHCNATDLFALRNKDFIIAGIAEKEKKEKLSQITESL